MKNGTIELTDTMFPANTYTGESVRGILLEYIIQLYSKVNTISKRYEHSGKDNYLFWQFPAITEKDAYMRHLNKGCIAIIKNKTIKLYFPFPWATFIDKNFNTKDLSFLIARKFVSGIADILKSNNISFEIHTVCQHIRWEEILPICRDLGVTDFACISLYERSIPPTKRIHPWMLFAPNIEDPNRTNGIHHKLISDRNYLASFIGAYMDHYINDDRQILQDINFPDTYIQVKNRWHLNDVVYKYQINSKSVPQNHKDQQSVDITKYNEILCNSKFSLCPIGAGPNTLRFWESIAVGSIPVFFNRKFIPPFLNEFNRHTGRTLDSRDIFVYAPLDRNDPNSVIKMLRSYSLDQLEERSKLCKDTMLSLKIDFVCETEKQLDDPLKDSRSIFIEA